MNTKLFPHFLTGAMLIMALLGVPINAIGASSPSATSTVEEITSLPVDLVDERLSTVGIVWTYSTQTVGWVWGVLRDNVFSWIIPPTPASLTNSVSKKDAGQLFKLLGYAGYKLKEIDTDVGIIPGLSFKFGQSSELSEADYENLESLLEEWERASPGVYASLQRKIIKTVMSVNTGGDYQVSTLKVKLLPLPDVSFIMTPKQTFLGEESGTLMRAIQRVERNVRSLSKEKKN
ncbi:hypothetical protein CCP3SC5AM1_950009 [Gammaproteobacteria bacterium]